MTEPGLTLWQRAALAVALALLLAVIISMAADIERLKRATRPRLVGGTDTEPFRVPNTTTPPAGDPPGALSEPS